MPSCRTQLYLGVTRQWGKCEEEEEESEDQEEEEDEDKDTAADIFFNAYKQGFIYRKSCFVIFSRVKIMLWLKML